MVAFARAQIGDPYVWGASGPNAWDCSGLTAAAYRRAGISLPHSSHAQARRGRAVARAHARPGDLVVWPGHVGIYAGGGYVIHAPQSGDRVKQARIWGAPRFRRLL